MSGNTDSAAEAQIVQLNSEIARKNSEISQLKALIAQSNTEVEKSLNMIADQQDQIKALQAQLVPLQAQLVRTLLHIGLRRSSLLLQASSDNGLSADFDFGRRVFQCVVPNPGVGYRNTPAFPDKVCESA
jgi:septal ring factor EnvC (AmiA/AmiB activator)